MKTIEKTEGRLERPRASRSAAPNSSRPQHEARRLLLLLGADPLEMHNAVLRGLPFAMITEWQKLYKMTAADTLRILQISERTLARRRETGRLDRLESDRLIRIAKLFAQATRLFNGDANAGRDWMCKEQRSLGNVIPVELAMSEVGAQEVERALLRIEHGVFA